jgi:hypothetical protein
LARKRLLTERVQVLALAAALAHVAEDEVAERQEALEEALVTDVQMPNLLILQEV